VWSLYVFGDLYNTLVIVSFFSFLHDSVTPSGARRLYGLIVLGGVLGGAFGTSFVGLWIDELRTPVLLWVCAGLTTLLLVIILAAGRLVAPRAMPEAPSSDSSSEPEPSALVAGAKLVMRSRYLMAIGGVVALYELASAIIDFQFTSIVAESLDGPAIEQHFATVFAITNVLALIIQVGITNVVMTRLPLQAALLVSPVCVAAASASFLAVPALITGSALNIADNAPSYSINQSARETLYTVTERREKYQAKAFIDMFGQRFAKGTGLGACLVLTLVLDHQTIRWLSVVTLIAASAWVWAATYAGRRFHELGGRDDSPS
jgi:ATP:ADP antiporter, AAA family